MRVLSDELKPISDNRRNRETTAINLARFGESYGFVELGIAFVVMSELPDEVNVNGGGSVGDFLQT